MEPSRRPRAGLTVVEWGAIDLANVDAPVEGAIAEARSIPAGLRRRLGVFERAIVQAVLGLAQPDHAAKVTLGSRYGNMTSAARILEALAMGQPPSPTLFSHSVLNAGCGVANQVRKDRSSHTAVAAGPRTLHGTLTEAWLQTEGEDAAAHIVTLVDAPFPELYETLQTGWRADVCIGLRVQRCSPGPASQSTSLGTDGFLALLTALRSGHHQLTLTDSDWVAGT